MSNIYPYDIIFYMEGRFGHFIILLIGSLTLVPAGHQSQTVLNITVCNVERYHENDSVIKQTLEKLWLFNFGFRFFMLPRKLDFRYQTFDVSSVFLKPIPNRLSGFCTSLIFIL